MRQRQPPGSSKRSLSSPKNLQPFPRARPLPFLLLLRRQYCQLLPPRSQNMPPVLPVLYGPPRLQRNLAVSPPASKFTSPLKLCIVFSATVEFFSGLWHCMEIIRNSIIVFFRRWNTSHFVKILFCQRNTVIQCILPFIIFS